MSEQTVLSSLAPKLALLHALSVEGTLTKAAARVGLSQPTASRLLAALSAELGTPVVVSAGRGIRLSRAGAALAEAAGRALSELATGVRQVADEADPERGSVVLAFLYTLGEQRVPGLLQAFRSQHPRVRFTLLQGVHADLLDHVRSGRAELAFTSPVPSTDEFARTTVETQPLVLTVHAEHRLAGRAWVRMAELAHEAFVAVKPGYGLRLITDELAQAAGFTPTLAFEGEQVDTLRGLVAADLGVAVLPAAEPSPPKGVVEIPLRPRAVRSIALIWSAERPMGPAAATFRDFVTSGT